MKCTGSRDSYRKGINLPIRYAPAGSRTNLLQILYLFPSLLDLKFHLETKLRDP